MLTKSIPSDFRPPWFPRLLSRFVFSHFKGADIDQYTAAPAADQNKFFHLHNVMPSVSGGFVRRWGLAPVPNSTLSLLPTRMLSYQAKEDVTVPGTQDTYLVLGAQGFSLNVLFSEVNGTPAYGLGQPVGGNVATDTGGGLSGSTVGFENLSACDLHAVTSRNWFYAAYGAAQGQKINFSQRNQNTASNWGIPAPTTDTTLHFSSYGGVGRFTSVPTVTITGGGGSGATATANCNGTNVEYIAVTNGGSGYTSVPTVTITGNGSGATATAFLNGDMVSGVTITSKGSGYTAIPTVTIAAPTSGTTATAVALLNAPYLFIESFTVTNQGSGYTSTPTVTVSGGGMTQDASALVILTDTGSTSEGVREVVTQGPIMLVKGRTYSYTLGNSITGHYGDLYYSTITQVPHSDSGQAGFDSIYVTVVAKITDSQIDNAELLATADGQGITQLYGIGNTGVSGTLLTWNHIDTLPDTVNNYYSTGETLLTTDLWVDIDASGNPVGIAGNQPPQATANLPVVSQGRMFMTDGLNVFFSKSIDEVTTSTGLITSKWEEAWPGTNTLSLISDNEKIVGLLSANGSVYIGTTQNIIILTGSDADSFSAQIQFHNTGLLSPDLWTLVYKDNMPIGMMWVTPDLKIMFSDFSSYENIGVGIYPFLENATFTSSSLQSFSYGPFAFVAFNAVFNGVPYVFLFDTVGKGWYTWSANNSAANFGDGPCPIFAYTNYSGIANLYLAAQHNVTYALGYFLSTAAQDAAFLGYAAANVDWKIQTAWQSLEDPTAYKILNEVEVWTNEPTTTASVYAANTTADYLNAGLTPIKSATVITSPLGAYKLFLAGVPSKARFYSFAFGCTTPGTDPHVLDQFSVEAYTMSRL